MSHCGQAESISPSLDPALPEHVAVGETRRDLDVVRQILVDERRIGGQRVIDRQHGRQRFVIDLDRAVPPPGCFSVASGHGRDRLAEIDGLSFGQRYFVLAKGAGARAGKILARDDGGDAGDRARCVELVAADFSMRMGAADIAP